MKWNIATLIMPGRLMLVSLPIEPVILSAAKDLGPPTRYTTARGTIYHCHPERSASVILSAAKDLGPRPGRLFASLRVTLVGRPAGAITLDIG